MAERCPPAAGLSGGRANGAGRGRSLLPAPPLLLRTAGRRRLTAVAGPGLTAAAPSPLRPLFPPLGRRHFARLRQPAAAGCCEASAGNGPGG